MKKPKQPKKPTAPKKPTIPEKTLKYNKTFYLDLYSDGDKQSIGSILSQIPDGVSTDDVYLFIENYDTGCCSNKSVSAYYAVEIENKQYKSQMKSYENKMVRYNDKLKEHKLKLEEWNIKNSEYLKELELWKIEHTASEIKKLERQLKKLKQAS